MATNVANIPAPMPVNKLNKGSLIFPSDLEEYRFYISFDFRKFTRRQISDRAFYGPGAGGGTEITRLPIPNNMIDTTSVIWGEQGMSSVLGAVIEIGADMRDAAKQAKSIQDRLEDLIKNAGMGLGAAAVGTLAGMGGINAIAALAGVAINPFMTVMFQSPTFKRHQFQWSFYPHTKEETETLRTILARFKLHTLSSVRQGTAGLLLNYPDMCYVTLHPNNVDLYKFKPCVIEAASVNYAPNGPSFFDGTDAPTEVILTVNLLEMEYWIQEDVLATWDKNLDAGGSILVDTQPSGLPANTPTGRKGPV